MPNYSLYPNTLPKYTLTSLIANQFPVLNIFRRKTLSEYVAVAQKLSATNWIRGPKILSGNHIGILRHPMNLG